MSKHRKIAFLLTLLLGGCLIFAQSGLSLKEIIEKNLKASGGREKLNQTQNISFQTGESTYYVDSKGRMKISIGKEPVITEVFVVGHDNMQRNCFNKITEIKGLEKARYEALAKLYSGLFTLLRFEGELSYQGLKTFGPLKLYHFTTKVRDLKVDFYLNQDEYTLKRLVFESHTTEGDKYEVNYDFGPFEERDGVKLPGSWFTSQVGTRGTLSELRDLKMNLPLDKDFLSRLDVNVGQVEIAQGSLRGNIVEFSSRGKDQLMISTNWTSDCIERAGFKALDRLILLVEATEIELTIHTAILPREALVPGAKIMSPSPQGENYLIYLLSPEIAQILEQLKPLLPIQIRKK